MPRTIQSIVELVERGEQRPLSLSSPSKSLSLSVDRKFLTGVSEVSELDFNLLMLEKLSCNPLWAVVKYSKILRLIMLEINANNLQLLYE